MTAMDMPILLFQPQLKHGRLEIIPSSEFWLPGTVEYTIIIKILQDDGKYKKKMNQYAF